ncbi:MAG TPA: SAM-dependent methyltransferase [Lachnospiraceae bacterium]|nr:SAM-dependent methyltransferase [Lachnospiraceae bacterium]
MPYMDIVKHYESCFGQYGDCCKGVDWPNAADAEKRYQVMLELLDFNGNDLRSKEKADILDFGCGLGHFYDYVRKSRPELNYTGMDISEVFIRTCRQKYPNTLFLRTDILKETFHPDKQYSYIIANGVFTEKRNLSYEEMFHYFKQMLSRLYRMCSCGMAFNVMSKDVDWERDDLFHVPFNELSAFLTKNITRDFIIRNDYGLYEYTVYLYKRDGEKQSLAGGEYK